MSGKAENEGEVNRAAACAYQRCVDNLEQTAQSVIIEGFCVIQLISERLKLVKVMHAVVKVESAEGEFSDAVGLTPPEWRTRPKTS